MSSFVHKRDLFIQLFLSLIPPDDPAPLIKEDIELVKIHIGITQESQQRFIVTLLNKINTDMTTPIGIPREMLQKIKDALVTWNESSEVGELEDLLTEIHNLSLS